jgi:hypothetical protein
MLTHAAAEVNNMPQRETPKLTYLGMPVALPLMMTIGRRSRFHRLVAL